MVATNEDGCALYPIGWKGWMAMVIEYKDNVELTKALMTVLEFGYENNGQIVFYSNCRNFQTEVLDENGGLRGMAFGVEEIPNE